MKRISALLLCLAMLLCLTACGGAEEEAAGISHGEGSSGEIGGLGVEPPFEENFSFDAFAENPGRYGDRLIELRVEPVQLLQEEEFGAEHSFVIAADAEGNAYYINMYGFVPDIHSGDSVSLVALPLAYFTYPNASGRQIPAIACAAVSLSK